MVPNLFCLKGRFLWRVLRATMLIFYILLPSSPSFLLFSFPSRLHSPPLLPPFSYSHSPPVQQLGVLGEQVSSPSGSTQLEIFRFLARIRYFHHNEHSGSYPTGLPCQNVNFAVCCTYIFKIL